jgi:hypothetical protein
MTIDFEKDQQDAMKKTEGIQSLADQVEKLETCNDRIADIEADFKNDERKKRSIIRRGNSNHDV